MMSLVLEQKDPPIGAYLVSNLTGTNFQWGHETQFSLEGGVNLSNSPAISRHLARNNPSLNLYPSHILQRTQVDHWLSVASNLNNGGKLASLLPLFNDSLALSQCLVPAKQTVADYEVFGSLYKNNEWHDLIKSSKAPVHLLRWYNSMLSMVSDVLSRLPADVKASCASFVEKKPSSSDQKKTGGKREEGGKYVELPGAEMGKVVVRFPPEASGYLHIGHAKAALLNQHYQLAFKGQLIMRFDDTNPAKEDSHFEKVILGDLKLLQINPDRFTHTSDYFDLMISYCEKLMEKGLAYVDDTDAETMKAERDERKDSKNRNNSLDKNMKMWREMIKGSVVGQKCAVRAKIDMTSNNGCMRDPTIYRCKPEEHVRTGKKYKVYPTYDFACPIVDSIEGVTHALRTTEYHDRDEQFEWFIEKLGLRKVHIYEYSRLNMNNTVLSKRKLTWFVEQGLVDGWDDPRFPTVRGIIRRGMTVEGLKEFIIAQGSSRSVVNMEWDKIWSFNKKVIDGRAPRYTALEKSCLVPVIIADAKEESNIVQKHPKDPNIGLKKVWTGQKIFIEAVDAELLKEGENATFINWGNLTIKKINRSSGKISSVDAVTNLTNTDYKKTLKLTWLVNNDMKAPMTPVVCVYFDHLISKGVLGKEEDFKSFIGHPTRREIEMFGDDELKQLKEGEIIQLQRKGYFRVDGEYKPVSPSSCKEVPVVLFSIPDGHSKENMFSAAERKTLSSNSGGKKKSEKSPVKVVSSNSILDIHANIKKVGDKIRQMKAEKADKSLVMNEVAVLKDLKASFKTASGGVEWTPEIDVSQFDKVSSSQPKEKYQSSPVSLHECVVEKGNLVRKLKSDKTPKDQITAAVNDLLAAKKKFLEATGIEWKPDINMSQFKRSDSNLEQSSSTNASSLHQRIVDQGNIVRNLKSSKAPKDEITAAVNILLDAKKAFKDNTGIDWKPDIDMNPFQKVESPPVQSSKNISTRDSSANDPLFLHNNVVTQGNTVRELKSKKASKDEVTAAVKILLAAKEDFKKATGIDWKPEIDISQFKENVAPTDEIKSEDSSALSSKHKQIVEQGNKVRSLKSSKAAKEEITAAVSVLLDLKKQFKDLSGIDWKPDIDLSSVTGSKSSKADYSRDAKVLHESIVSQGNKVRELKGSGAEKSVIKVEVDKLLSLKGEFKEATNIAWKPDISLDSISSKPLVSNSSKPPTQPKENKKASKNVEAKVEDGKKQTRLGMECGKLENLSEWYSQVITKSEMIEYYNVSGCYILRPWSYHIWDFIKNFIDFEIKKLGVENCYFPIFVSKDALEKEKDHIEDFSPEVAWVTRSGSSDLAEPIAIRPTSETVMYPAYAKWIQSHRDLPMRLNQWNNVVRWEFKQPTPFLRTREFLWQEGHTAFATKAEATEEVYQILEIYARTYEELLAIPVIRGKKTDKEKFAGGDFTTTTEAFVSASGRGIQGATSHHLGQNFSKMCDITFEDPNTKEKEFVYQNSWGLTTRTIGVMVMVHGDDKGLVLPPRVASIQAVIMPVGITAKVTEDEKNALYDECKKLENELKQKGVRCKSDLRDNVTPAWKFNHWELKGVPLRLELGPREVKEGNVFVVRRDSGEKQPLKREGISNGISTLLENVHQSMYNKAVADLTSHTKIVTKWGDFNSTLDGGNLLLVPYCGIEECEDLIKKDSARDQDAEPGAPSMGAKSLCIPFQQPKALVPGAACIHPVCKRPAKYYCMFGRSY